MYKNIFFSDTLKNGQLKIANLEMRHRKRKSLRQAYVYVHGDRELAIPQAKYIYTVYIRNRNLIIKRISLFSKVV